MKFTHVLAMTAAAGLMLTGCDSGGGSRESIRAVGSSTVYPFAKLVAESFARSNSDMRSPLIESTGSGGGIALFCTRAFAPFSPNSRDNRTFLSNGPGLRGPCEPAPSHAAASLPLLHIWGCLGPCCVACAHSPSASGCRRSPGRWSKC